MTDLFETAAIAFAVSLIATPIVRWLTLAAGVVDVPNARSSHAVPTPRSGGIAILSGAAVAMATAAVMMKPLAPFLIAAAVIAAIGLADDLWSLSATARLVIQAVAATFVVAAGDWISLPDDRSVAAVAAFGAVFWVVGLTNAYNFMDGINGIASVEAIACSVALTVISLRQLDIAAAVVAIALGGAAAGFLPWNFPKAKIFMGDVASGTLGFAFAFLVVRHGTAGGSVIAAALPLLPFLADTSVTLVLRARRRERLFSAHRSHFYQRLTSAGLGHAPVTLLWGAVAFIGAGVAIVYQSLSPAARLLGVGVYALLHVAIGIGIVLVERRVAQTRSA